MDALLISKAHALIGVSMGGLTSVAVVSRYPDRVGRLIACDFNVISNPASVRIWKERVQMAKSRGMENLAKQSVERWFTPQSRDSPMWNQAISMAAAASIKGFEHSARVFYDFDETENMKQIRIPALYVVGACDGSNTENMRNFVARYAPGAKLAEIAGAGHLPMIENTLGFVESIDTFLRI